MNSDSLNPYAPPQTERIADLPAASMETLRVTGPIRFAGAPGEGVLEEFLRAFGHVSARYLLLHGFAMLMALLVLCIIGGGVILMCIGGMGLTVITLTVSTLPYRRLVFINANPHWNKIVRGQLLSDGVHLDRGDTSAFFRWDWFSHAVVSDQAVAFVPATQTGQPIFLSMPMLERLDDWSRLLEVAGAVGIASDESPDDDEPRERNLRILRNRKRDRSVEMPNGAIEFDGALSAKDFSRIPGRYRRREKPTRSYVVVTGLYCFGSLIVIGASSMLIQQSGMLYGFVVAYAALSVTALAVRKFRRRRTNDEVVYFLNAIATESSIVSDFAITTTDVCWTALQLVSQTDDFIAIRRRDWIQFIIARRDMFSDDEAWQVFNALVVRKLGH